MTIKGVKGYYIGYGSLTEDRKGGQIIMIEIGNNKYRIEEQKDGSIKINANKHMITTQTATSVVVGVEDDR